MKTDRITNLIAGSIILTLGTIVVTWYQARKNKDAAWWVDHSYEVINQSSDYLSLIKDLETNQRGYLITGDSSYLIPYRATEKNLLQHFNHLKELVADNAAHEILLNDKVKPFEERRIKILNDAIRSYRQKKSGRCLCHREHPYR